MPSPTDGAPFWWLEDPLPPSVRQGLLVRRLHEEASEFQTIQVFENDALGKVLVLDGVLQTTQGDEFVYHEMLVHVALASRPTGSRASVAVPTWGRCTAR